MEYTGEHATLYQKYRGEFKETDTDVFEVLKSIGIKGKDVLDLGCGGGYHTFHIKELGAKSVVGLDISRDFISEANKVLKTRPDVGIKFIEADASKMPLFDGIFDVVFSNFVIHYFEDSSEIFKEISRVLKPRGYFVGTFSDLCISALDLIRF